MAIEIVRRKIFENLPPTLTEKFATHMESQTFNQYMHTHGVLEPETERDIEERAKDSGRPCVFLDLGAGRGVGVLEASRHTNVSAWGLSLHPPDFDELKNRWIQGHIEETAIPDSFDVIQSRYGLHHAVNIVGLENALNSLKEKGVLNIDFRELTESGKPDVHRFLLNEYPTASARRKKELEEMIPALAIRRVFKTLRHQGFDVPRMYGIPKESDLFGTVRLFPHAIAIIRGKQPADLSAFYDWNGLNRIPIPVHHILNAPTTREKMIG